MSRSRPPRTPTPLFLRTMTYFVQDKFDQIAKELPQLIDAGCEVRVKDVGYTVQRTKGSTDEPTVGDNLMGVLKGLACLPLINRLTKKKVYKKSHEITPCRYCM